MNSEIHESLHESWATSIAKSSRKNVATAQDSSSKMRAIRAQQVAEIDRIASEKREKLYQAAGTNSKAVGLLPLGARIALHRELWGDAKKK